MHNWDVQEEDDRCPASVDRADALAVCRHLCVPLEEADFVREYWTDVFEGMLDGYRRGRTPNPDVHCNRHIKFGSLLRWVRERRGADELLATGHYARTQRVYAGEAAADGAESRDAPYVGTDMRKTLHATLALLDSLKPSAPLRPPSSVLSSAANPTPQTPSSLNAFDALSPIASGRRLLGTRLLTALDARKDQTYFLSTIAPSALPSLLFPLGTLLKSSTRALAAHAGLPTSEKPDSMGICMIGRRPFSSFLSHYLTLTPGHFVDPHGRRLAAHRGQETYTIGQGAKVGGQRRRLYVAGKEPSGDVVVVDDRLHPLLLHDSVVLSDVSWVEGEPRAIPRARRSGAVGALPQHRTATTDRRGTSPRL